LKGLKRTTLGYLLTTLRTLETSMGIENRVEKIVRTTLGCFGDLIGNFGNIYANDTLGNLTQMRTMNDMNVLINTLLINFISFIISKEFGLIGTNYNFEFQMNKPCTYKFI